MQALKDLQSRRKQRSNGNTQAAADAATLANGGTELRGVVFLQKRQDTLSEAKQLVSDLTAGARGLLPISTNLEKKLKSAKIDCSSMVVSLTDVMKELKEIKSSADSLLKTIPTCKETELTGHRGTLKNLQGRVDTVLPMFLDATTSADMLLVQQQAGVKRAGLLQRWKTWRLENAFKKGGFGDSHAAIRSTVITSHLKSEEDSRHAMGKSLQSWPHQVRTYPWEAPRFREWRSGLTAAPVFQC